jgi:thiamine biosynthesis protein ThiC
MPEEETTCTMCGDFCAMKKGMQVFKDDIGEDKKNVCYGMEMNENEKTE